MLSWLRKLIEACWWPVQRRYARMSTDVADFNDELLWYKDLVQHGGGELSMALVQANSNLEDQSQVETGPSGTFVGIYDGHGGPDAAYYVCDHLYQNVQRFAREHAGMSVDVLKKAFQATEDGFMNFVSRTWQTQTKLATVGSCCLVGIIYGEMLYVANLGDSRAVMGTLHKGSTISALQLTVEHNASHEEVRRELRALHPDDAHIVLQKHGVWRVKGIIQISRSIGDAYLKKAEFQSRETLSARFQLPEPLKRPVLSSEPSVLVQKLRPQDKFIIFASDGLWEHLSNQEAAEIVHNHPRSGVARRLIRAALQEAAKKRETRYSDLKKIEKGIRRHFHDDITIVVVFLDNGPLGNLSNIPQVSIRGGVDSISVPSSLFSIDGRDGHRNGLGG